MTNLRPGDDVIAGAATYRETLFIPSLVGSTVATVIRAAAPGTVKVKGSEAVAGWVQVSADTWAVAWRTDEPEQVFRDGVPLKQIGGTVFRGFPTDPSNELVGLHAPEGIWPGRVEGNKSTLPIDAFTYDRTEQRLYVRLSTALGVAEALEVSTRTYVLMAREAVGVVIDGIDFLHANTSLTQRHPAVYLGGRGNTIRNSTIRHMDAFCVGLIGDDSKLLNSTVEYCGQAGVSANGARITVSGNRVAYNNTRGFNKFWEAGGMKFIGGPVLADSTVTNNTAVFNNGDGIWFDWDPVRASIEGNTAAYNGGDGIHFEAASAGNIRNNLAYGNGHRGIYIFESSDTAVTGNIAFGNTLQGIAVRDGSRSATNPRLKPYRNSIVGNTVAWNDSHGNRIQFMLPDFAYGNTSDRNRSHATDVTPRYAAGDPTPLNPYSQGLPLWRSRSGQDHGSVESSGAMPAALATALAERRLLSKAELPPLLQTAGVP